MAGYRHWLVLFFVVLSAACVTALIYQGQRRANRNRNKGLYYDEDEEDDDDYQGITGNKGYTGIVPDEQRLYHDLMEGYENSVRPVMNASETLVIRFSLRLNQIIGLDERHQVLTTNVFIDQDWVDENLKWNSTEYNGIKHLRIPAHRVWLPDTFVFNNADDGSTGFMAGIHVLVNENGSVLWPVPVKLKSSCKVDITYFPFDDQTCILRFGSWIYSINWMDFVSTHQNVDLENYVDNSEWDLISVTFEKRVERAGASNERRSDLTYTLHIRRRTFYYIFNIIVPCIMLSVLTLLTFWLPTTSGEKVTLGLSVFLAFSMFMLLIAEEVPATSESVPLIGIYLTTVMTMTSVSVILAVLVINVYNKGYKFREVPPWLRTIILKYLSAIMCMKHDIPRLAHLIRLPEEDGDGLRCDIHSNPDEWPLQKILKRGDHVHPSGENDSRTVVMDHVDVNLNGREQLLTRRKANSVYDNLSDSPNLGAYEQETSLIEDCDSQRSSISDELTNNTAYLQDPDRRVHFSCECDKMSINENSEEMCQRQNELMKQKVVIAEWQRIAAVIDRLLFWAYFVGTIVSYVVILFIIPGSKPGLNDQNPNNQRRAMNVPVHHYQ
ncbi:neuronal acetylcholine receptor subunit alpha-10-like [Tubulanus polymorphus]|uniref:neuronal acetylcholine receptor subunit alpha-10-like n=1 Tax=Tubulanus polymorphus TaxID=672921 RepID=UPI003DA31DE5